MPRGLLARLRDLFDGNPAVREVADDPALMAELLLLLRMVLADGAIAERELATLRRIADEAFGIGEDDLELVVTHIRDFGYEISTQQAIDVFRELDKERRLLLARHLATIAESDAELNQHEVRLLARVVEMLDLTATEVAGRHSG